jgi:Protein of unknown function (DUF2723)
VAARRFAAALLVSVAAFFLYRSTLLPGVDFGDTGSFQATVGSTDISPRDGYPLYFAVGNLFVAATGAEPAHALNLASAVEGAAAIGLVAMATTELCGSMWAASAAALLFAGSYTFWSQAIIAEVYALHACFVSLTLWLLLRWHRRPILGTLASFFAVYALGFGNHLSMILLAPAYTVFLLIAAPAGWRSMLRPRVIALASALAALGALQYAWNLRELWHTPHPPAGLVDALQIFWFDVTKSDWRETMIARVPSSMFGERLAMFGFDLRQQFGLVGPALAIAGLARTWIASWRVGVLMSAMWLANAGFAFGYNVGDTHVFVLPAHLTLALLAAPGLLAAAAALERLGGRRAAASATAVLAFCYAGLRVYRDYPALDRSRDRRPAEMLNALTAGVDDRHAILLTDLNWQIQNGLSYFTKQTNPWIADARMPDVLLFAPALVRDNRAIGRDVVLTERANAELAGAFGPLFATAVDARSAPPRLAEIVSRVPRGTRYALAVLKHSRDLRLDESDLASAARTLGAEIPRTRGDYFAVAGVVGEPPVLVADSDTPFTRDAAVGGTPVQIRMESWLAFDTIRRMGFGHVVAGHRHTLIVERGVSFVAFGADGEPIATAYRANIFAPQRRFVIAGERGDR